MGVALRRCLRLVLLDGVRGGGDGVGGAGEGIGEGDGVGEGRIGEVGESFSSSSSSGDELT